MHDLVSCKCYHSIFDMKYSAVYQANETYVLKKYTCIHIRRCIQYTFQKTCQFALNATKAEKNFHEIVLYTSNYFICTSILFK